MTRALWLLPLSLLLGCTPDPVDQCQAFFDAFAATAERCGHDPDDKVDELLELILEDKTCADVVSIRDPKGMDDACIPWVEELSCDLLDDPSMEIRPFCQDQLQL